MNRSRFTIALVLVALTGFIALSYEICWIRLFNFASGSRAWVFGAMLGTYLIGLACGSLLSLMFQDRTDGSNLKHLHALSWFVLLANIFGFLLVPLASWIIPMVSSWGLAINIITLQRFSYLVPLPMVGLGAALLGAILPLICHFAIPPDHKAGARLSYLYLANILGSGAGSLLTGFVLMDIFSMGQICQLLLALGLTLSLGLAFYSKMPLPKLRNHTILVLVLGAALLTAAGPLFHGMYERLQWKERYKEKGEFKLLVESRFGVISVGQNNKIYGGGVYDGRLYTDLEAGSSMIRPYFISAVHEAPKDVLVIGLSGGAWTQILLNNPYVERVVAVEINAAYENRVIPHCEQVRSILDNPKLDIVTDDGRRWLRMHPEEKFDVIVANSTFHYREHATSLLSKEFMEQINDHLNPGGIYIFNTTGSTRSIRTALDVFTDVNLLLNNVLGSNQTIEVNRERLSKVLSEYTIDGKPVLDMQSEAGRNELVDILEFLEHIDQMEHGWRQTYLTKKTLPEFIYGHSQLPVREQKPITDDNLGHEFPNIRQLLR